MDSGQVKTAANDSRGLEPLFVPGAEYTEPVSREGVTVLSALQENEGLARKEVHTASETCLGEQSPSKQPSTTEEGQAGHPFGDEVGGRGDNEKQGDMPSGDIKGREEGQKDIKSNAAREEGDTEEDAASAPDTLLGASRHSLLTGSQEPNEEARSQLEALKQAHRSSADFPEALYELLFTLQEGRRFNDQRCSFRQKAGMARRRCLSEPCTTRPGKRVIFSSMTSLQREEFFELVAVTQARRLDDQRALLQVSPPHNKTKSRSLRGSLKQLSILKKPVQTPVPKEDLYNMIRTTQSQGRLEDQRSRAPGPTDDEDFFSLLLRVQGGRMEEQRTELPQILQT